jgi:polysaccharide export outer membrane protein
LNRTIFSTLPVALFALILTSCGSYRQNLMFKVSDATKLQTDLVEAERNYIIRPNDVLSLKVYTNDGERIIDPDYKLTKDIPNLSALNVSGKEIFYTVDPAGVVKIPMIGDINLKGLSLREAEAILQKEYSRFYQAPFVNLSFDKTSRLSKCSPWRKGSIWMESPITSGSSVATTFSLPTLAPWKAIGKRT